MLAWCLAGCATTPKIDWNSRLGNYTYDQAVVELGPPDRSAQLTDGSVVAEWLTMRGYSGGAVYHYGGPYYRWSPGPMIYHYADPPAPDRFLRLVFGPDGKLASWKQVYK
jgi:hypothetical protein